MKCYSLSKPFNRLNQWGFISSTLWEWKIYKYIITYKSSRGMPFTKTT